MQPQHTGFDRIEADAVAGFTVLAPTCLYIHDLLHLFTEALVAEGVQGHLCGVADQEGHLLPLVGDDPQLAIRSTTRDDLDFTIEAADGSALVVRLAASGPVGRKKRARLHLLATVYASYALPLLEAGEDALGAHDTLTPLEHDCLALAIAGSSGLDIGERFELSAPAVGIVLRRAAARLGVDSFAEAAAIALARNLISS